MGPAWLRSAFVVTGDPSDPTHRPHSRRAASAWSGDSTDICSAWDRARRRARSSEHGVGDFRADRENRSTSRSCRRAPTGGRSRASRRGRLRTGCGSPRCGRGSSLRRSGSATAVHRTGHRSRAERWRFPGRKKSRTQGWARLYAQSPGHGSRELGDGPRGSGQRCPEGRHTRGPQPWVPGVSRIRWMRTRSVCRGCGRRPCSGPIRSSTASSPNG